MGPNVEAINVRLSHLQNVRADLLRKVVALASLRKQVQLREAALAEMTKTQRLKAGDTSHSQLPTTG